MPAANQVWADYRGVSHVTTFTGSVTPRPVCSLQYLGWTPKRLQDVMGHSSIRMTFDLYGHLFENVKKDRDDMAKIEAAMRVA